MQALPLLSLPFIGAGIGWFTNFLAVKMLFHPRQPVRILGMKIQGLVPRRQPELAERIGEIVEAEFAIHDRIAEILNDRESLALFRRILTEKVDAFIAERQGTMGGLFAAFLGEDRLRQLRDAVVDSAMSNIPQAVEGASRRLEERLAIRETVADRIAHFDLDKLEEITRRVAHQELKHIELFGGLLGFLIGVVQAGVLWAIG